MALSFSFIECDECRETHEFLRNWTSGINTEDLLNPAYWNHKNNKSQLFLLAGDEFDYFYFLTKTEPFSEKVVIAYKKLGNAKNYIKVAGYDMAVGHLLLDSF